MKQIMTLALLGAVVGLFAVTVDPGKAEIVAAEKADGTVQFAAQELQRHLQMITGKKIPIVKKQSSKKYAFLMGTPAGVKLAPEESRWEVTPGYTRIYGDSTLAGSPQIKKKDFWQQTLKAAICTPCTTSLKNSWECFSFPPAPKGLLTTKVPF
jgi:hypothetical protein